MGKLTSLIFGMLLLFFGAGFVQAQLPPEDTVGRFLYVDRQNSQASDGNPGTEALPLKTISKAAALALQNQNNNIGTKILIYPGTYRETIDYSTYGPTDKTVSVIFEAKDKGTVIISGSDVWTDWQRQGTTTIYTHSWPYDWGLAPSPSGWPALQDIARRREMIFVNGKSLTQVLSSAALKEATFYISETDNLVYMWPPAGVETGKATIEVATRSGLFYANGKRNVVLRGLVFQHDNTPVGGIAVKFVNSSSILVEDCRFLWNNWAGFSFNTSQNVTARRNVANHNGGSGMNDYKIKTLLFEENETSYNNWRGAQGGFDDWAVAGVKDLLIHDGTYRRHKSVGNQTRGFWLDTDCVNILVENILCCDNLTDGIFIEASQGPMTIRTGTICRNQRGRGILLGNASDVTLDKNIIYGNSGPQVEVSGDSDRARPVTNWETGAAIPLYAERWTFKNNVIGGGDASQLLITTTLSSTLWQKFVDSLTSDSNLWWNPQKTAVFQVAGGAQLDFSGWKSATGRDANSLWAGPRFVDPAHDNFSLLPDSPLLGMGWPSLPNAASGLAVTVAP